VAVAAPAEVFDSRSTDVCSVLMRCRVCCVLALALAVLAVVMLVMLGSLAAACGEAEYQASDDAQLQDYIQDYFELINAGDEEGLRAHLANAAQPQDAAERIQAYRPLGLSNIQVSVSAISGFRDWYLVEVRAKTKDGRAVRFKESVVWSDAPFAGAPPWHWSMAPLRPLSSRIVGIWREAGGESGCLIKVKQIGDLSDGLFRVAYPRLRGSPLSFSEETSDDAGVKGASALAVRYVATPRTPVAAVIVYDYASDRLVVTTGGSDCGHESIRVSEL